jgi:hypothetical protein
MMKIAPLPTPRECDDGVKFPSVAASEQQNLPSSREEEDFRLYRCLRNYVKIRA